MYAERFYCDRFWARRYFPALGAALGRRKDVQDAIYAALHADATLKTLSGATATDLRVYQSFGLKERTVTSGNPGFTSIWDRTMGRPYLDRESFEFQVSAYAKSYNRCKDMADRYDAVLHRQTLGATGWTDVSMKRTSRSARWDVTEGLWQYDCIFQVRVFS